MQKGRHVVIIGNGVAGVTAARFIRKMSAGDEITIISGETEHFYARTALMYIYMGHLRYKDIKPYEDGFWSANRIRLVRGWVSEVDITSKRLRLASGAHMDYDVLLIATGSRSRRGGWAGEKLPGVQGLYGIPDLNCMAESTHGVRRAAVVGGGLIGVEMAEMLHSRGIAISLLARESGFFNRVLPEEESRMVGEEIARHGIDLRLGTEVERFKAAPGGRVAAVVTRGGETIPAEFVGITIGVEPNVDFLRGSGVEVNRGVLVNEYLETSAPNVYAAGDCAEFRDPAVGHKPVEQLWYTGRRHGFTVAHTICGRRTAYRKGLFFNSAKFFDLEYQTYGFVPAATPPGQDSVFWTDEAGRRALRVQFEQASGAVVGFNVLGVRLRQQVCEQWINEQRTVDYVLAHLNDAAFDQEFERKLKLPQLVTTNR